jgi:hypothetical protein
MLKNHNKMPECQRKVSLASAFVSAGNLPQSGIGIPEQWFSLVLLVTPQWNINIIGYGNGDQTI